MQKGNILKVKTLDNNLIYELIDIYANNIKDREKSKPVKLYLESPVTDVGFSMIEELPIIKAFGTHFNIEMYAEGDLDMCSTILLSAGTNGFRKARKDTTFSLGPFDESELKDMEADLPGLPKGNLLLSMSSADVCRLTFASFTTGNMYELLTAYSLGKSFGTDMALKCRIIDGLF